MFSSLLSPEPVGWIQHHQLYSSAGADIVMESITLIDLRRAGILRAIAILFANTRPGVSQSAFLINLAAQPRVCLAEVNSVPKGRAFRRTVLGHRQQRGVRCRSALLRDYETFGITSTLPS